MTTFGRKKNTRTVGQNYQSVVMMIFFTLLMSAGIGSRLAYLQLVQGSRSSQLADSNRIRIIDKQPERGVIYDRNGKILVSGRLSHSVYLWPMAHTKKGWPEVAQRLSTILEVSQADLEEQLEQAGPNSSQLIRVARGITPEQFTALHEYEKDLDGVEVYIESVRNYPNGSVGAHLLGYTRNISPEMLKTKKQEGYKQRDLIGQMGVEKAYENLLRGEWGGQQVEVNGAGRPIKVLGEKPAKPGKDIHLTIDLDVQKVAEKALGDRKGAIVAMDPNNGAILAMVSRPAFDPNLFSKDRLSKKDWETVQGKEHPLVNRALSAFPPASTFKIITASAGLETGKFTPDTVLQTFGSLTVGGVTFGEWNHSGFGPLGFVGALQNSSDTFFYQIGRKVGGPGLIEWARNYGFGKKTGIELANEESRGFVPDEAWKQKVFKIPWTVGDSINMSIGQGALQVTPLQSAVMFAAAANGGYRVQPHLLKDDEEKKNFRVSLNMKPSTIKILRDGLRKVVSDGTARSLNLPSIPPAAGKTGTAEAGKDRPNHTWFGAYAPSEKPEIVVVAFGENSGEHGGTVCGPMVLKVFEDYFQRKYPGKYAKPVADEKDVKPLKAPSSGRTTD
ncbi:MAG: penicillin-binding protein 2 [Nostocaceae cyanobacterium]|nr:penicillin-binding protein 2 [Nostocaceae cyanobacterium]